MGSIDITQYRISIGCFNTVGNSKKIKSELFFWNFIVPNIIFVKWVAPKLLLSSGDVEYNPGPDINVSDSNLLTIGHANLRSLSSNVKDPTDPHRKISKYI